MDNGRCGATRHICNVQRRGRQLLEYFQRKHELRVVERRDQSLQSTGVQRISTKRDTQQCPFTTMCRTWMSCTQRALTSLDSCLHRCNTSGTTSRTIDERSCPKPTCAGRELALGWCSMLHPPPRQTTSTTYKHGLECGRMRWTPSALAQRNAKDKLVDDGRSDIDWGRC